MPVVRAAEACRVLLVEDDFLIAMGTVDMLEDLGHEVVQAGSAREALEILQSGQTFDLVITDHAMPGMNGTEFAIRCRQTWKDLPIVLATGYSDLPVEAELGLPKLSKPYRQEELARQIAALVRPQPLGASASRVAMAGGSKRWAY
jgi:CheY-like chemotaxis protein